MMIIVTFLMTKTIIIVTMKELVTITIVTVIMITYRQKSIRKKRKKTWLNYKIGQVNTHRNIF